MGIFWGMGSKSLSVSAMLKNGLYSHFQYEDLSYDLLKFYPLVTRLVHSCAMSTPIRAYSPTFISFLWTYNIVISVLPDTHLHLKLSHGKHALHKDINNKTKVERG